MNHLTSSRLLRSALLGAAVFTLGACDDDDDPMTPEPTPVTFDVEIENVSVAYDLASAAVFNTPVGATGPGPLASGGAYEASFIAGPGNRLHFATMLVQSNDLFYAPSADGIELYSNGSPVTGDITSQIMLWDAGTEVNQEPGSGADQAPRQGGADTGDADGNNAVRLDDNSFGNLPAVTDAIRVTLSYDGPNQFTLRVENIASEIMVSGGGMAPMLLAPGVVAAGGMNVLFTADQADGGYGLEALAEDGDPSGLLSHLQGRVGVTSPLAPGAWAVHTGSNVLFTSGSPASAGLEAMAEDGNAAPLAAELAANSNVSSSGVFNTPNGAAGPGPLMPGSSYTFTVDAVPGDMLSFGTMFVQSNDLFYAPSGNGIALFNGSLGVSGDVTSQIMLWDAGTEANERPGVGVNQAPRQSGPNTGDDEGGNVRLEDDAYDYPSPVLRVTITPRS